MGEKKIAKNWWQVEPGNKRVPHKIDMGKAVTVDDLPQPLTACEAAKFLGNCHPKTVERLWRNGELKYFKILSRRKVTTPEYIAEYLRKKMRHG